MRKLRLIPEDLRVETFQITNASPWSRGTVRGQGEEELPTGGSCDYDCHLPSDEFTCLSCVAACGFTFDPSCFFSCDVTCPGTCELERSGCAICS